MQDLKSELASMRKQSRSINNRIQSILYDSRFVLRVGDYFSRPLVANRRCGSWYVPADVCATSCYFKSTDGHTHQWQFSVRRLNLHLLELIRQENGVVIVDSTRRGKLMPDAASKTIPIWCSVINKANGFDGELWVPPSVVSASEREQISARIDGWAQLLKSTTDSYHIDKPLRPIWFNHGDTFQNPSPELPSSFRPVIICTASSQAQDGEQQMSGFTYVQGAADDHELWAGNLTPEKFWESPELHQSPRSESEMQALIDSLLGSAAQAQASSLAGECILSDHFKLSNEPSGKCVIDVRSTSKQQWPLPPGKKGSRMLSNHLKPICDYFEQNGPDATILSDPGSDFGVSIALMLDALFFDLQGNPLEKKRLSHVPKDEFNQRLAKLTGKSGSVPSRTTLNLVGGFLRR